MLDAARISQSCSLEADWFLNVTRVSVAQVPLSRAAAVSEPRFLRDTQWSSDGKPGRVGVVVLFRIFFALVLSCVYRVFHDFRA